MTSQSRRGTFLGLPYDFRTLTADRVRSGVWSRQRRVWLPKAWGWGYGINLREVARRLRLIRH